MAFSRPKTNEAASSGKSEDDLMKEIFLEQLQIEPRLSKSLSQPSSSSKKAPSPGRPSHRKRKSPPCKLSKLQARKHSLQLQDHASPLLNLKKSNAKVAMIKSKKSCLSNAIIKIKNRSYDEIVKTLLESTGNLTITEKPKPVDPNFLTKDLEDLILESLALPSNDSIVTAGADRESSNSPTTPPSEKQSVPESTETEINVDELASYFDELVQIPRDMSAMADNMYT